MEKEKAIKDQQKISLGIHVIFCTLSAIIIYMAVNTYAKQLVVNEDEEIAVSAVLFLLGGIYIGRFISQLWIPANKAVPYWILLLLPLIMTACIFLCVLFASSLLSHHTLMYILFLTLPLFILSITTGMFVKLIRERIKRQLLQYEAVAAHSQGELQLLQSQLSPHFLFNTLNNMYGIALTEHEKIPPLMLKLSDLLRYSVYDVKEMFVSLKEEIVYLNNYIDFEKIRVGERLALTIDLADNVASAVRIAPMLLIIFVENAFKHSKNSSDEKIFIDIALKIWQQSILFSIKNSHGNTTENKAGNKHSGFGLESVRKRLELLYPGAFDLKIEDEKGFYNVMLRLNIK